jgi:hypothetical protein
MRLCENCYRRHWRAKIKKTTGLQVKHNNGNLVYVCVYCGNVQEEDEPVIPIPQRIQANILYIDLETSKSLYYNYGAKVPSKYLQVGNLVKEWYMIGWSASYVGNNNVWSQVVSPESALAWDDSQIVGRPWELINAAEIIAGHNVQGFDIKRCNTRFKKHGLPAITGKKYIDTLKLARSHYALESNTLDYICKWLGINGKDCITNEDWIAAMNGDAKTLQRIEKYNRGDVINGKAVLEEMLPTANKPYRFGALKLTPYPIAPELKKPKRSEIK